jgi:hypothetical protein
VIVPAQLQILLAWLLVGSVVLGLGLAARAPLSQEADVWSAFWLGFGVLLVLLQIWHLVLPVDDRARLTVVALGVAGLVLRGRLAARALVCQLPALGLVAVSTWWLSNRSLAGPRFGDTGMYFVPTVRWLEAYPIVPGLANLFVPLGHNFSYFLYVALLDGGPFGGRPWHIANGLLVLALFARAFLAATRLLGRPRSPVAVELYWVFTLPGLVALATGILLTSPTPDFAVHALGFVLAGELLALVTSERPERARCLALVFLAGAGMTVKPTLGALAATTIALALAWWCWKARPSPAQALRTVALGVAIAAVPVATWIGRNVITSGCPLYPSAVGAFPVDWRTHNDATAWIQRPMEFPLRTFVLDPRWARQRLESLGWDDPEVRTPALVLAAALVLVALVRPVRWWRGRDGEVPVVVLVPPLLSLAFVFYNTPMPKYQGATLWVLAIEALLIAVAGAAADARAWMRTGAVIVAAAGGSLVLLHTGPLLVQLTGFEPVSRPRVAPRELASGLTVQVPLAGDLCSDAPLPCTPEPHPALRLRRPGDLGAGFTIDVGTDRRDAR